MMVQISYM